MKSTPKKVYCRNCKHSLHVHYYDIDFDFCRKFIKCCDGLNGEDVYYPEITKDINDNGECEYYKKKWWKFWVS